MKAIPIALALVLSISLAQGGEVMLTEKGLPRMPILIGSADHPAAAELRRTLRKISGADLEISAATPGAVGIYVGVASNFPWLGLQGEGAELGPEGCLVRSDGKNLLLIGGGEPGASHAVNTFLLELGCRWFFPGDVWEVLPQTPTIRGDWNLKQRPDFHIQRHLGYGFGAYRQNADDKDAWDRHNRLGGSVAVSISHAGHGLSSNDFTRAPELFAMREGKRVYGSKPCYSHPEFIRRTSERVLAAAAKGREMISLTPADGLGYCECPLCQSWAQGNEVVWDKGTQFAKRPDGRLVCITSESLFNCINAAARALRESHSGALIGTYAYSAYSHPPSFPIEPNVFIQTTTAYRRTPMSLKEQLESFRAMGVQSGIRAYWAVYQWDWDGPTVTGELALNRLVDDLRFYHTNNVRSLNTEMSCNWGPRGLGYYLGARLLWNVNENPKALVADFYQRAFGPAAKAMERYYVRWLGSGAQTSARSDPPTERPATVEIATPTDELGDAAAAPFSREALQAAFTDLDEAARLVKDLPGPKARVDHLRLYALYLALRFDLEDAAKRRDREAIVHAVREETVFGARIMRTNMIHTRPLIGKAFHRRFKAYRHYLQGLPEWPQDPTDGWSEGFRTTRQDVPDAEEIERLWTARMGH
jgi:hypothetical protein